MQVIFLTTLIHFFNDDAPKLIALNSPQRKSDLVGCINCFPCADAFVMQQPTMRRFGLILICMLAFVAVSVTAGTYKLTDGTQIIGDPISMTERGVQFKLSDASVPPPVAWEKLTPDALKDLYAHATSANDRKLLQPLIDDIPVTAVKLKDLPINPVTFPERPTHNLGLFAMFSSSVGLVIILVLYGATLFAAYEVALYRRQPVATVCGLAAIPFVGVLSPIAFIMMPGKAPPAETADAPPPPTPEVALPGTTPVAATEAPRRTPSGAVRAPIHMPGVESPVEQQAIPETPAFPAPIVFARGDYSFNRRFFETKFPGFFRAIRAEAEKDLVLLFKTSRGDFVGRRITNITPNELYLQVFINDVTADEMIPFTEVMEVQIRHKDAP